MNHRLIIRPEAEVDLTKAALWYEDREHDLGSALMAEVRAAIERVLLRPEAFTRIRKQPTIHRVLVRRFPYRIFYVLTADTVVVSQFCMQPDMKRCGRIESDATLFAAERRNVYSFDVAISISRLCRKANDSTNSTRAIKNARARPR